MERRRSLLVGLSLCVLMVLLAMSTRSCQQVLWRAWTLNRIAVGGERLSLPTGLFRMPGEGEPIVGSWLGTDDALFPDAQLLSISERHRLPRCSQAVVDGLAEQWVAACGERCLRVSSAPFQTPQGVVATAVTGSVPTAFSGGLHIAMCVRGTKVHMIFDGDEFSAEFDELVADIVELMGSPLRGPAPG